MAEPNENTDGFVKKVLEKNLKKMHVYRIRHSLNPNYGLTDMSSDIALRSTGKKFVKTLVGKPLGLLR